MADRMKLPASCRKVASPRLLEATPSEHGGIHHCHKGARKLLRGCSGSWDSAHIPQDLADVGHLWSSLVNIWPKPAEVSGTGARVGQNLAHIGQTPRSNSSQIESRLAKPGNKKTRLVEVGSNSPKIGKQVAQVGQNSGRSSAPRATFEQLSNFGSRPFRIG